MEVGTANGNAIAIGNDIGQVNPTSRLLGLTGRQLLRLGIGLECAAKKEASFDPVALNGPGCHAERLSGFGFSEPTEEAACDDAR